MSLRLVHVPALKVGFWTTTHNRLTMAAARHDRFVRSFRVAAHRVGSCRCVHVPLSGLATRVACVIVGNVAPVQPAIVDVVGDFVGGRLVG